MPFGALQKTAALDTEGHIVVAGHLQERFRGYTVDF